MLTNVFIVLAATLASLIAMPVDGGFRISLGVVVLFAGIHLFHVKRPILWAAIGGLSISLFRMLVASFSGPMSGMEASNHLWEFFFFIGYGIIYYYAIRRNTSDYPLPLVAALSLGDAGGNFLEYYLRHLAADEAWATTSLLTILLAAVLRSVLIVTIVWLGSRFVKPGPNREKVRYD
ncbi:MAG: hypothetical protein ACOX00_00340 [Peptoniphilaceae bacterium]|jgi:hypothetical protein|nr:hypothetical protein [Bacillota bacterium]